MKNPKRIHPLAAENEKSGKIKFIHGGNEHIFYSCVNKLTNERMSAFDADAPTIGDTIQWVKSVFTDIKRKAIVLECIGDF